MGTTWKHKRKQDLVCFVTVGSCVLHGGRCLAQLTKCLSSEAGDLEMGSLGGTCLRMVFAAPACWPVITHRHTHLHMRAHTRAFRSFIKLILRFGIMFVGIEESGREILLAVEN